MILVNYQAVSDEIPGAETRTVVSASTLPFSLHLGHGVWNDTSLSENQRAGWLVLLSSFVDNKNVG